MVTPSFTPVPDAPGWWVLYFVDEFVGYPYWVGRIEVINGKPFLGEVRLVPHPPFRWYGPVPHGPLPEPEATE